MQVARFYGLNNVADPIDLGLEWQTVADNILITDAGKVKRRDGTVKVFAANIREGYATRDRSRFYVQIDDTVAVMVSPSEALVLRSGLTAGRMRWAELNDEVYFTNGFDSGIIAADNTVRLWAWPVSAAPTLHAVTGNLDPGQYLVTCTFLLPDGRETGTGDVASLTIAAGQALQITGIPQRAGLMTQVYIAPANSAALQFAVATTQAAITWDAGPDMLGAELRTQDLSPLPVGAAIPAFWGGRCYVAQYLPELASTVVWRSEPLAPHLFDLEQGFFMVPGEVVLMAAHEAGLVIGTRSDIRLFDGALKTLADYGAIPGDVVLHGKDLWFWTERGAARALPFENVTEAAISVAPGRAAQAAVLERDGNTHLLVTLQQGGTAFNPRSLP